MSSTRLQYQVQWSRPRSFPRLEGTAVDDGGLRFVIDLSVARTSSLDGLDNAHRTIVSDLAEHDVAAIEPAGLHSGDEELRAVAVGTRVSRC